MDKFRLHKILTESISKVLAEGVLNRTATVEDLLDTYNRNSYCINVIQNEDIKRYLSNLRICLLKARNLKQRKAPAASYDDNTPSESWWSILRGDRTHRNHNDNYFSRFGNDLKSPEQNWRYLQSALGVGDSYGSYNDYVDRWNNRKANGLRSNAVYTNEEWVNALRDDYERFNRSQELSDELNNAPSPTHREAIKQLHYTAKNLLRILRR